MEDAIAAMSAGIPLAVPSKIREGKPLKRGIESDAGMTNKKRKWMQDRHVDRKGLVNSVKKPLLAQTLEEAKFASVGGVVADATESNSFKNRDTMLIRKCFVAVVNTKKELISLVDGKCVDLANGSSITVSDTLFSKAGDLMVAINQMKQLQLNCAVSEGINFTKVWRALCESSSIESCRTLLMILQSLDAIYCELMAWSARLTSKVDGYLLPNPAVYMWCTSVEGKGNESMMRRTNNPLLSYLEYRNVEALRLSLSTLLASITAREGVEEGPHEGTMRGKCPVTSPTMSLWRDICRDRICQWAAFACPDKNALDLIAKFCSGAKEDSTSDMILEIGAGTGYWASVLRKEGLSVLPTDRTGSPRTLENNKKNMNEYHGWFSHWCKVEPLSVAGARFSTSNVDLLNRALACDTMLLVYPPPNNNMAFNAVSSFRGNRLIYVGEFLGDTANRLFETTLAKDFICAGIKALPNWSNTAARISFWIRKSAPFTTPEGVFETNLETSPMRCGGCGKCLWSLLHSAKQDSSKGSAPFFYRDRLTRCVYACSKECMDKDTVAELLSQESQLRHLHAVTVQDVMKWKKIVCD